MGYLAFISEFKNVILSGAPHRFIASNSACGAESTETGGAYLTHAAPSFSTTEVVFSTEKL